jgi:hypothetical protein
MPELIDELVRLSGVEEAAHPPLQVALRLAAALVFGWILALIYKRTHTGDRFSTAIPHAQVLLAVGGALIWLVVGNNLVRAFGLAGTIGLIRYRTRIRDPKDTTVLLFSMIIGMACGLGQYVVAAIGTLFVVVTLAWLAMAHKRGQARLSGATSELRDLIEMGEEREDQ